MVGLQAAEVHGRSSQMGSGRKRGRQVATTVRLQAAEVLGPSSKMGSGRKRGQQVATTVGLQAAEVLGPSGQMGSGRKVPRHPLAVGVRSEAGAAQMEQAGHGSSRQTASGRIVPRKQAAVVMTKVVEAATEVRQVLHMASSA